MKLPLLPLIFFIVIIQPGYADSDGRWQLTVSGLDQIEFGTQNLAGGLRVGWTSTLEFYIEQGRFVQGTGTARLEPDISTFSRPEDMFTCRQVKGSFVSSSGQGFSTPHLRYQAFPVSGKVDNGRVQLVPFFEYPGNYYALLYECATSNSLGSFWAENAPRISRELSKRQDALIKSESGSFQASIKEIRNIEPGPEVNLPLIDKLEFTLKENYGLRTLTYRLDRMIDE